MTKINKKEKARAGREKLKILKHSGHPPPPFLQEGEGGGGGLSRQPDFQKGGA